MLFFIHRQNEEKFRNRTEINEDELLANHKNLRQVRIRGGFNAKQTISQVKTPDDLLDEKITGQPKRRKSYSFLMFAMMALAVGLPIVVLMILRNVLLPGGYTAIKSDGLVGGYIAAGGFGMGCLFMLPFISEKLNKKFEKRFGKETVREWLNTNSTYAIKIVVLFSFIVSFPFMVFGMKNYAGYNDAGIVYSSYFSMTPTTTNYSEIKSINRYFHRDNDGKISSMHYIITLKNDEKLDILFSTDGYVNQTYEIHKKIEAAKPELFTTAVDEPIADIQRYLRNHSQDERAKIYYFFGITA